MNKRTLKQNVLILLFAVIMAATGYTQPPPTPPGGSSGPGSGGAGNQLGANAPVGSGMVILLILGATYGLKKYQNTKTE